MRVDFRPSARGTQAYVDARRMLGGECYWNGHKIPDVCVADTTTGEIAILAKNELGNTMAGADGLPVVCFLPRGHIVIVARDGTRYEGSEAPIARATRVYDFAEIA